MRREDGYHLNLEQMIPDAATEINKIIAFKAVYACRIIIRDKKGYNHTDNNYYLSQQVLLYMFSKEEAKRMIVIQQNNKTKASC